MARAHAALEDPEKAAIYAIIRELPEDHPAREAYRAGADPIRLMNLVEREDLVEKLNQAWLDWYSGRLRQQRKGSAA
jgi:hypothetical protein